jgi:hypothetical protein
MPRRLGRPIGLAVVLAVAGLALWNFEWWPAIPIAGLATVVILATSWPLDQGRVRSGAVGVGFALLLIAGGAFLFFLAQFKARPCDACTDNSVWLVPGILAVLAGFGILAVSVLTIARSGRKPVDPPEPATSR